MPIDEKDLDQVFDLKCKYFIKQMQPGKFYSYEEIKDLILTSSIHRPQIHSASDSSKAVLDIAYVEAVIQAQYAVGNLRCGEKNGRRYYAKNVNAVSE
jgi:hypothetical protein